MKALTSFIAVPLLLWCQAALPDPPAGQRFAEWLKVFNGGDKEEIQPYFEKNFPRRVQMIDQTMALRQKSGCR